MLLQAAQDTVNTTKEQLAQITDINMVQKEIIDRLVTKVLAFYCSSQAYIYVSGRTV